MPVTVPSPWPMSVRPASALYARFLVSRPWIGPAAPTKGNGSASSADIDTSRLSASHHAIGKPSASCSNAAMQPNATDAQNALEKAASSTATRCTRGSANSAFTATHSNTWTATTAAPMPTSGGPTSRAMMNTDAKESVADVAASKPDQKTLFA